MELSIKLKQRFCKDNNLAIQLFSEPYFQERVELLGYKDKYDKFKMLVETQFDGNEERYFEYYNQLKDKIIDYIKESQAYKGLLQEDMNKFAVNTGIKQSDVYKIPNIGKTFISIDMIKANFSSLVHYGIENGLDFFRSFNYADFVRQFTNIEYFTESKYIRQVVFGNCCPKRQVTYEKYLMAGLLNELINITGVSKEAVYSLCSDEIILCTDKMTEEQQEAVLTFFVKQIKFPVRIETFTLEAVTSAENKKDISSNDVYAYVKRYNRCNYELKCVEPVNIPFVLKAVAGINTIESDLVFSYNGRLAKLLEEPYLRVVK